MFKKKAQQSDTPQKADLFKTLVKTSEEVQKLLSANYKKQTFQDPDFKTDASSLMLPKSSKLSTGLQEQCKKVKWVRPSEIFQSENFQVFEQDINPSDIIQGELGNCYFLSALSALAEFPNRIRNIFVTPTVNQNGIYSVRFCLNGEFKEIVVDDYFPCKENEPVFSKARNHELWVLILEKAWAKINHNYENTVAGFTSEALRCLTGAPVEFYNHEFTEQLWEQIFESDKKNYIICASAGKPTINSEDYNKIGLVSDHAYSVIKAVDIETKEYGRIKLLQLRNPWGHKEWMGAWSDKSDKWTDELKTTLGYVDADDGVFFIAYNDYMNYYRSTTICKIHDGFHHHSLYIQQDGQKYQLIQIEIKQQSKVFFTAVQPTERFVRQNLPNGNNYQTSFVKLMLGRLNRDNPKEPVDFIQATCSNYDNVSIESKDELQPGDYIILVEVDWRQDVLKEVTLSTYSATDQVSLRQLPFDNNGFLQEVLKSCARQKTARKTFEDKGDPNIFRCISITDSDSEYGYIYYQNDSTQEVEFRETCLFNKMENFVALPPHDQGFNGNKLQIPVRVKPKENAIIVLRRTDRQASYSVSYFTSLIFPDDYYLTQIPEKAKKQQIKYQGESKDIHFYSMVTGVGYFWFFENNTRNLIFDSTFTFDLTNLEIEEETKGADTMNLVLKPGEKKIKKLVLIDPAQAWGYKFSYQFKCLENLISETELIKTVQQLGQIKRFKYQGLEQKMQYTVHFINEEYVFLFENDETEKTFRGTFNFVLENLKIQGEPDGATSFKVELIPRQKVIKRIQRLNPVNESKYKCSYSYCFEKIEQVPNADENTKSSITQPPETEYLNTQSQILFQLKGKTHVTLSDLKKNLGKKPCFERAYQGLLDSERLFQVVNKDNEDRELFILKNRIMDAYINQGYKTTALEKKKQPDLVATESIQSSSGFQKVGDQIKTSEIEKNDIEKMATAQVVEADETADMTEEERTEAQKKKMIKQMMRLEQEHEQLKYKMNNDVGYINHLHEYNYLKDACFQLVEIVANIAQVPSKEIFEQYEIRDVENDGK